MGESLIKKELLSELDTEWAHVERICAGMSEADMLKPGVEGEWSVKDILCHLSAWEKYLLDRLGYALTGQKPLYPVMKDWDDVHRFNAQVYAENKERPLNSAKIEFLTLYKGVITVLESLEDEQLIKPYSYDFPDDGLSLLQLIRANTYEHFREHCVAIERER